MIKMHIIFVCTGNTCRSPMAEALLRKKTKLHTVSSAGLSVSFPSPAAENAVAVMQEHGLDISAHRARPLTAEDIKQADLILTMTSGHRSILTAVFPEAAEKTFTLCEYAGTPGDIDDPFGGDMDTYRRCAAALAARIEEADL